MNLTGTFIREGREGMFTKRTQRTQRAQSGDREGFLRVLRALPVKSIFSYPSRIASGFTE